MTIKEHYYEVLDMLSDMFIFIFDGLNERYAPEIAAVGQQFPCKPLKYLSPSLRLTYQEGMAMLKEAGFDADPKEDISTVHEKALGKLVADKYVETALLLRLLLVRVLLLGCAAAAPARTALLPTCHTATATATATTTTTATD